MKSVNYWKREERRLQREAVGKTQEFTQLLTFDTRLSSLENLGGGEAAKVKREQKRPPGFTNYSREGASCELKEIFPGLSQPLPLT